MIARPNLLGVGSRVVWWRRKHRASVTTGEESAGGNKRSMPKLEVGDPIWCRENLPNLVLSTLCRLTVKKESL